RSFRELTLGWERKVTGSFKESLCIFGIWVCLSNEEFGEVLTVSTPQCDRICRLTITAGPPSFLDIRFNRYGWGVVNDCPNIRYVNAHPERIGSNNDGNVTLHKCFQGLFSNEGAEARVVRKHWFAE